MIKLHADTPGDQETIEKFQRAYENLRKIIDKLEDENRKLRKEFEEYRKRHLSNIGIKNGKPYVISLAENIPESDESHEVHGTTDEIKKWNPGAQPGHRGYFRIRKDPTRRIRIHLDINECPEWHHSLRRKGTGKRLVRIYLT